MAEQSAIANGLRIDLAAERLQTAVLRQQVARLEQELSDLGGAFEVAQHTQLITSALLTETTAQLNLCIEKSQP